MNNQSCQTDFIEYTEFTPIVTAIKIKDPDNIDDDDDCEICGCCCLCLWYLTLGGLVVGLLYYIGGI